MPATVRSSSIANASSAGASWAIAMPAGAVAGDVVYVTIVMLNISSGRTANLTTEGFATLRNNDVVSGNTKTSLFRRVLDGSEDGTITGAFVGGGGNNWTAIAVCAQDADNTTPEDATVVATIAATAVGNAQVCPDATAVGADDLWLGMVAGGSNSGTYTWPNPPTELQDGGSTGRISMAQEALSAAGPCGTRTATSTASGALYNAYTILVKSAATVTTPTRVTALASVPSPGLAASPAPARVTAVASVPSVVPQVSATPVRVDAVASVPSVNVAVGTFVTPTRVNAVASVPSPVVVASGTLTTTRVDAVASVPTTVIGIRALPSRVDAVATVASSSTVATALLTPTRVDALATVPAVTTLVGTTLAASTVTAYAIVPSTGIGLAVGATRVDAVTIIAQAVPVETESYVRLIGPLTNVSWANQQPTFLKRKAALIAGPTPTSMTIYKLDGVWKAGQMLTTAIVNAASVVHLGGHEFDVTYTEYLEMVEDGVVPQIVEVLA